MNPQVLSTMLLVLVIACTKATTDHDKVQPIPQPEPVTVSEKAAIKFKPLFVATKGSCLSFPAVSVNGEVTGGLKGTNGNDGCNEAPLGSQVYGRAGWYRDRWAIMYTWYFPKNFSWMMPNRRHDWNSVVLWIDNPALETPKILGVSMSKSDSEYNKELRLLATYFAGSRKSGRRYHRVITLGSDTTLRFQHTTDLGSSYIHFSQIDGVMQDLVMWEQLSDAAREALNDSKNFEGAEVPFNDINYEKHLESAWPF